MGDGACEWAIITTATKLLIVEDERATVEFLRRGLSEEGFAVDVARDAASAEAAVAGGDYDVIVLDVMLPGADGFSLCKRWRAAGVEAPILFLTAREFTLLEYLALRAGRIVTRSDLLEHVWDGADAVESNVVDVYIRYLRNKLGRDPDLITTVRGGGYVFEPP